MTDYDSIQALNWSTLKLVHTSPKLCRLRADKPREDTEALVLGRAIHCAFFEPDRWAQEYTTEPDFGEQLTKDGEPAKNPKATASYRKAFASWRAGLPAAVTVLDAELFTTAETCAAAIGAHRVAVAALAGGGAEQIITWTDPETGTQCKARLDKLTPRHVADAKSTRHDTVRTFLRDAERLLYHGQLAWYHDGAIAAGRLPADAARPFMVGVQTCEPFDVYPLQMTERSLEAGRALYRGLIDRYLQCQAADYWPGCAPDLLDWDVGKFAAGTEGAMFDDQSKEW